MDIQSLPPDTCVALLRYLEQFITPNRIDKVKQVLANQTRNITLVLEGIYHLRKRRLSQGLFTVNPSRCFCPAECGGAAEVMKKPQIFLGLSLFRKITLFPYYTTPWICRTPNDHLIPATAM